MIPMERIWETCIVFRLCQECWGSGLRRYQKSKQDIFPHKREIKCHNCDICGGSGRLEGGSTPKIKTKLLISDPHEAIEYYYLPNISYVDFSYFPTFVINGETIYMDYGDYLVWYVDDTYSIEPRKDKRYDSIIHYMRKIGLDIVELLELSPGKELNDISIAYRDFFNQIIMHIDDLKTHQLIVKEND